MWCDLSLCGGRGLDQSQGTRTAPVLLLACHNRWLAKVAGQLATWITLQSIVLKAAYDHSPGFCLKCGQVWRNLQHAGHPKSEYGRVVY